MATWGCGCRETRPDSLGPRATEVLIAPSSPPALAFPLSAEGFPAYAASFIHWLPQRYVKDFFTERLRNDDTRRNPKVVWGKWVQSRNGLFYARWTVVPSLSCRFAIALCCLHIIHYAARCWMDWVCQQQGRWLQWWFQQRRVMCQPSVVIKAHLFRGCFLVARGSALSCTGRLKGINSDFHFSCVDFSTGLFLKLSNSPLACLESLPVAHLADCGNPRIH